MLKQLLKQIWTQRKINAWLWAELIIVFICMSYVVDYLYTTGVIYFSPLGFKTDHVYQIQLGQIPANSPDYVEGETADMRQEQFFSILARLRAYPGVKSVSLSGNSFPYSFGSSSGMRGIDTTWVHGNVYTVSPHFFEVFRFKDKEGQTQPLVDAAMQARTMIINAEAEKEFQENGINPLNSGMKNYNGTEPYVTVRAICADSRFDDFALQYPAYYQCISETQLWNDRGTYVEICALVDAGVDGKEFERTFRKELKQQLRVGNFYLLEVKSFDDIRTNYYQARGNINEVKTHIAGLSFLLLNIFLGVIGTFWIRTQQRRGEIGIRIAMGSSRKQIRYFLMGEGLLLLILAAIPSIIISFNILYFRLIDQNREMEPDFATFIICQCITFLITALMIIAGILFPASQAMKIEPALALRDE